MTPENLESIGKTMGTFGKRPKLAAVEHYFAFICLASLTTAELSDRQVEMRINPIRLKAL